MQGYIKIYRQLVENPLWLLKPFSEGQAWIDLLCIATYDKGFIKSKNGQIIKLERGDCGYSILSLSERWGWSRGKVTRFLTFLNEQQMIQQKTYGKHTIINIINYDKYQKRTTNDTTNDTTNGQQMIQQTDTINKVKNDKNDKKENIINPDFYFSDNKQKVFEIYKKTCTNLIALSYETKNKRILDKINSYLVEIDNNFEQYQLLCEKANKLQKIADRKIDFEMMLNCYIGIMNGKYQQKSKGVTRESIQAAMQAYKLKKGLSGG